MRISDWSSDVCSSDLMVLAIGIVVDDAIVVVENIERNMRLGYSPRESAHRTMDEVGSAVVSIALVLTAVFVPVAFIPGISGQFYLQFAITIAVATVISAANSLTLSPALAAVLFKPHGGPHSRFPLARAGRFLADTFNNGFDRMSEAYGKVVRFLVSRRIHVGVMLLPFAGLLGATV